MPRDLRSPRAAVIVVAAGDGRRVGASTNKILLPLAGLPVFAWSLRRLESQEYVDQVVVVVRELDRELITTTIRDHFPGLDAQVVVGGDTRHASEWNGLRAVASTIDEGAIDVVVIHDGARPLADARLFRAVTDAAAEHGGALPVRERGALVPRETSRETSGETSRETPRGKHRGTLRWADAEDHIRLVAVQTPQAFRAKPLLDAYRQAERDGFVGTDTASCVERYTDLEIHCVPSTAANLKITFLEDIAVAERLLANR